MADIFSDITQAIGTVAAISPAIPTPANSTVAVPAAPTTEDRLVALEQFAVQRGPVIEKIAPLLEAL